MADELSSEDLPVLESSIRRLLGPVATAETIDGIIVEIRSGASA